MHHLAGNPNLTRKLGLADAFQGPQSLNPGRQSLSKVIHPVMVWCIQGVDKRPFVDTLYSL